MIYISPAAENRIVEILKDNTDPDNRLRIFVEGGGCSGFNYGFAIDKCNTDDWEIALEKTTVLVDPVSMQYLENIIIDFQKSIEGDRFVINNPNAKTTCGCGSSFNPL